MRRTTTDAGDEREQQMVGADAAAIRATLHMLPTFAQLAPNTLAVLARDAALQCFDRGTTLFGNDTPPAGLYIVLDGAVTLVIATPHGRERTVEVFDVGAIFGELAMFGEAPFRASIIAVSHTRVIRLPTSNVLEAVRHDAEFALRMLRLTARRAQSLIDAIAKVAPSDADKRIAAYLLQRIEHALTDTNEIRLSAPKYVIASTLNLSKETFSRALGRLRDARIIDGGGGRRVIVRDRARLAAILEL